MRGKTAAHTPFSASYIVGIEAAAAIHSSVKLYVLV